MLRARAASGWAETDPRTWAVGLAGEMHGVVLWDAAARADVGSADAPAVR